MKLLIARNKVEDIQGNAKWFKEGQENGTSNIYPHSKLVGLNHRQGLSVTDHFLSQWHPSCFILTGNLPNTAQDNFFLFIFIFIFLQIMFLQLPHCISPPAGRKQHLESMCVSLSSKVDVQDYLKHLSAEWLPPQRVHSTLLEALLPLSRTFTTPLCTVGRP